MKAHLLHRDCDFVPAEVPNAADLVQDLELGEILAAMAAGDEFLSDTARAVVLSSMTDCESVRYRQQVLQDCIEHPDVVRTLYDLSTEAVARERRFYRSMFRTPSSTLLRATGVMQGFVELLHQLRELADRSADRLGSEGFRTFFAMLVDELGDDFFAEVDDHLRTLRFRHGLLESALLGVGNQGVDYVLRRPSADGRGWLGRLVHGGPESYVLTIADRDEQGSRTLSLLRDRGLNHVANALAQSVDHILSFFQMVRLESGFYLGCVNLHERLRSKGEPACFPRPEEAGGWPPRIVAQGLYDVSLTLRLSDRVVGNDLASDGSPLVVVTGANQGGKSTFLRSVGQALLMLQCGMFVGATSFAATLRSGVHTHYKREEDASMASGRFDDELARMSRTVDRITPGSLLLCNESFSATNELEGSQIARDLIHALLDSRVALVFVTHLYYLAQGLQESGTPALFLRAERSDGGRRTFRVVPGAPLPTSFGADVYDEVFGRADALSTSDRRNDGTTSTVTRQSNIQPTA